MSLTLDENSAHYQVRAYKPGFIQINDTTYTHSLIVAPQTLICDWPPQSLADLTYDNLKIILTLKPDILLIGTGAKLVFPKIEIYGELINQGIGIEIMNTHAAARTYNALTAEDRKVAAALIIQ